MYTFNKYTLNFVLLIVMHMHDWLTEFKIENNNKGHYINGDYNKEHPFKIISLKDNFLIKDKILIILLFLIS